MSKVEGSVWWRLLALVFAGSLLLAARGDDDDLPTPSADVDDDDNDDTADADDDSDEPDGLDDIDLPQCQAASAAVASLFAAAGMGGDLDEAREELDDIAAAAPDELEDDFEVLGELYAEIADAYEDAGFDVDDPPTSAADQARLAGAMAGMAMRFSEPAVAEASENISNWLEEECDEG
jgi:hypothetical protein